MIQCSEPSGMGKLVALLLTKEQNCLDFDLSFSQVSFHSMISYLKFCHVHGFTSTSKYPSCDGAELGRERLRRCSSDGSWEEACVRGGDGWLGMFVRRLYLNSGGGQLPRSYTRRSSISNRPTEEPERTGWL